MVRHSSRSPRRRRRKPRSRAAARRYYRQPHEEGHPVMKTQATKPIAAVDAAVDAAANSAADSAAPAVAPTAADPFDIASLRLNPSFLETAGVKKLITTVPVKKPSPQDFVRVHPAPEYQQNYAMIDLKDDREEYLVHPLIHEALIGEVVYKTVFTAVNRQGVCFLWPVRIPAPDDRKAEWPRSLRVAAEL